MSYRACTPADRAHCRLLRRHDAMDFRTRAILHFEPISRRAPALRRRAARASRRHADAPRASNRAARFRESNTTPPSLSFHEPRHTARPREYHFQALFLTSAILFDIFKIIRIFARIFIYRRMPILFPLFSLHGLAACRATQHARRLITTGIFQLARTRGRSRAVAP